MLTTIYWISLQAKGRLAIVPRPRSGDWLEDEIANLKTEGTDIVVSLLEAEEISDLDLRAEENLCRKENIEYVSFPIPDRGVPSSSSDTSAVVRGLSDKILHGFSVAVHFRAGIGRSCLVAACVGFYRA